MKRDGQHFFNECASDAWDNPRWFQRMLAHQVFTRLEYFDRVTSDWSNVTVLDLGCGPGFMSEVLAKRGAHVIGIDPSIHALKAARVHAISQNLSIEYKEGAGEAIPLASASVDRIVCVDVLEHVQDIRKVISECRRVLRPKGIFFFDTINRNRVAKFMVITLMEDILRIIPSGGHDPQKFIRPEEMKEYLMQAGFSSIGKFVGMDIARINRHLEFWFTLRNSTRIMYLGYAQ